MKAELTKYLEGRIAVNLVKLDVLIHKMKLRPESETQQNIVYTKELLGELQAALDVVKRCQ